MKVEIELDEGEVERLRNSGHEAAKRTGPDGSIGRVVLERAVAALPEPERDYPTGFIGNLLIGFARRGSDSARAVRETLNEALDFYDMEIVDAHR